MTRGLNFKKLKLFALLFILQFTGIFSLSAQKADSLKRVLSQLKEDTIKVNTLLNICSQNDITDSEKLQYATNAFTLSQKFNYQSGIRAAYICRANACNELGKYDEALKYLHEILAFAKKTNDKPVLANIYNSIGVSYFHMGNYKSALSHFLKSIDLYEKLKDQKSMVGGFHNIGLIYYRLKDYSRAVDYTTRAAGIYKQLKDTIRYALTQSQLGNINLDQGNYKPALEYYKKALIITEKLKNPTYTLASLMGMASVSFETGHYNEALFYDNRVLATARKINDESVIEQVLMNLGQEYTALNRFDEAILSTNEGIDIARKIGALHDASDGYLYLSEIYAKKNDFKNALKYNQLYVQLKDSVFNRESSEEINNLTAKYETEKKEKEIVLLNAKVWNDQKDKELLKLNVQEKNRIILSLIAGILLIGILLSLFLSRKKLKQQNSFQAELNNQQKTAANSLVHAQENERNRIAKELHDSVGTFLSTLKLNLQAFEKKIPEEHFAAFKNNNDLIDKTSLELRKITKDLSNEVLQENGLANAINELKENINASGATHIKFLTTEPTEKFDSIIELNLYRIAQELLNNSIKHSKATSITLQLIDHGDSLLLMLEDNGVGFDTQSQSVERSSGMGLKNIKERVAFLKGTLKIESILQKGSTFIIEVPKYNA